MINRELIAEALYTAYCQAVGGVAFNGESLPDWETFYTDDTKEKQANAWLAAADRATQLLTPEEIPPHQKRVIREQQKLEEKLTALSKFIAGSPIFKTLPDEERDDLIRQQQAMERYNSVLKSRINRF